MANGVTTGVITCPSDTDGDVSNVTTGFATNLVFFVGVNQDADGWEVDTQDTACMSQGVCSRQSGDVPANMAWLEKFSSAVGPSGGTGVYDNRCFQTYDVIGTDSSPQCRGAVTSFTTDGFAFTWVKAQAGRRVFYIAIGGSSMTCKQQSSYGTVSLGEEAAIAMLFFHSVLNSNSNVNPFGGFIWSNPNQTRDKGNGFTEYSFIGDILSQNSRAWGWPSIVNANQIVPVYEPDIFGLLFGSWQYSYQDAGGWLFPAPGLDVAQAPVAFAATAPDPEQIRQISANATGVYSWGDLYTPEALLICAPSNGPGWSQGFVSSEYLMRGTGFGIETKDGSLRVSLGVGNRSTDNAPYSWLLTDRSWVTDTDRANPGTSVQAGHIDITPGQLTYVTDDSDGVETALGILSIGPVGRPLVSLSAVKMAQHGDVNKVKG